MQNRTPARREDRPPLPAFSPVPRKCNRHDGWTPERQRAFIEALADTGSVTRAAAMVNMSTEGAYYLRRQPGAEEFRRAWDGALDYGVARMKDIAFERAIEGYLVPCFAGGRLLGWRRKYNDRLLMFCLRHYGEDASGRRTTINYFSTRASATAATSAPPPSAGEGGTRAEGVGGRGGPKPAAEAPTTTVRTIITGRGDAPNLDSSTAVIDAFPGVDLDDTARAEILAVLHDCAARRRAVEGTPDDPHQLFIAAEQPLEDMLVHDEGYSTPRRERRRRPPVLPNPVHPEAMLEPSTELLIQRDEQFRSSEEEMSWTMLDDEQGMQQIENAVASVKAANALPSPSPLAGEAGEGAADQPDLEAEYGGAVSPREGVSSAAEEKGNQMKNP